MTVPRLGATRGGAAGLAALVLALASHPAAAAGAGERPGLLAEAAAFLRAEARAFDLALPGVFVEAPAGEERLPTGATVRFGPVGRLATGPLVLTALVREPGRPERQVPLRAEVLAAASVWVAARDLPGGARLRRGDCRREVRVLPEGLDPAQARVRPTGRRLGASVPEGTILTAAHLRSPRPQEAQVLGDPADSQDGAGHAVAWPTAAREGEEPAARAAVSGASAPAAGGEAGRHGSVMEINHRTTEYRRIREAVREAPEVRPDLVGRVRASIRSGAYRPDAERIAERLIEEEAGS